jgi:hypothetical protein
MICALDRSLKKLSGKAAVSEEARRTVVWYVEPLSETRTKLEGFFRILV